MLNCLKAFFYFYTIFTTLWYMFHYAVVLSRVNVILYNLGKDLCIVEFYTESLKQLMFNWENPNEKIYSPVGQNKYFLSVD